MNELNRFNASIVWPNLPYCNAPKRRDASLIAFGHSHIILDHGINVSILHSPTFLRAVSVRSYALTLVAAFCFSCAAWSSELTSRK